jgi:simple sugar transport system substrate-binding protein
VDPTVKILYAQIGQAGYADAAGGKRVTNSVLAGGADVVFGLGDGASFGMLQAVETAKGHKAWFIDVVGDKSKVDKKHVLLSSVLWDFRKVYTQAVKDVEAGTYGKHDYILGASNGISLLKTKQIAPAAWTAAQAAQKRIVAGTVEIPSTPTSAAVKKLIKS